jgi:alanine racemase
MMNKTAISATTLFIGSEFATTTLGKSLLENSPLPEDIEISNEQLGHLSLVTTINYLKWVEEGTAISYGHTWSATRRTLVGTMLVGYGDGYPRHQSNQGSVMVRDEACPIIGRVCMDQTMIDLTDHTKANDLLGGEMVELCNSAESWGKMANQLNLTPYELLAGLTRRVDRIVAP